MRCVWQGLESGLIYSLSLLGMAGISIAWTKITELPLRCMCWMYPKTDTGGNCKFLQIIWTRNITLNVKPSFFWFDRSPVTMHMFLFPSSFYIARFVLLIMWADPDKTWDDSHSKASSANSLSSTATTYLSAIICPLTKFNKPVKWETKTKTELCVTAKRITEWVLLL